MISVKKQILENKYFSWLQFVSNWLMQGIFHADKSERLYKILFTVFFGCVFMLLLHYGFDLSWGKGVMVGFLIAHTLNWIVNNNFNVLIRHRIKWKRTSKEKLFGYLHQVRDRMKRAPDSDWVLYVVSHGGICRGTLNDHSDIDVSIIRKPGFVNMMKSIVFYVKEKKIADLNGVPLDIFICDSPENCISRAGGQENPIKIFDKENNVGRFYNKDLVLSIEEARKLNEN